jgi:hypothetical protein
MAKTKIIKTTTLEKRFEKLHHAANYAEECAKAIVHFMQKDLVLMESIRHSDEGIRQNVWCH